MKFVDDLNIRGKILVPTLLSVGIALAIVGNDTRLRLLAFKTR